MKYKKIFEDCKTLALRCGHYEKNPGVSEYAVYMDSFGCDFQVYYYNIFSRGVGEMRESVSVFLGGREVYCYYEHEPSWEKFVDGKWKELVSGLYSYHLHARLEENYCINGTLLELCKSESRRNRKKMSKNCGLCVIISKKHGRLEVNSPRKRLYKLKKIIGDYELEVFFLESVPKEKISYRDKVDVFFNKKSVFNFSWNCSDVGGLFDEKGIYVPGEWERILEKLAEGC